MDARGLTRRHRQRRPAPTGIIARLALGVGLLLAACGAAAAAEISEYQVKAALVFNFARFTQWPDPDRSADGTPLRVMILGDENVRREFAVIADRLVGSRPIVIESVPDDNDPTGAQIVFVAESGRDRWHSVLLALRDAPILTIGEANGFLEAGGMIDLETVNKKVRFHINLNRTRVAGLSLNSRMLKLASSVQGVPDQEP